MQAAQLTKKLRQRKEVVDLQIRGLECKRAFFLAGHEKLMPYIIAQAMNERVNLTAEDRQRLSQILNGNVQPADANLLGIAERAAATLKRSKSAA